MARTPIALTVGGQSYKIVANVPEEQILDALLKECREFQDKVERGDAKLGEKKVDVVPPDGYETALLSFQLGTTE